MTDSQVPNTDAAGSAEVLNGEVLDGEIVDDAADGVNTEAVNDDPSDGAPTGSEEVAGTTGPATPAELLAAERLEDLQRLQAEYVNYKRRVDRDRAVTQERAIRDVLETLLPVLDDIQAARDHGDLTEGPFAAIADKLEVTLGKFGLERFGARGEAFDPNTHEALLNSPWPQDDPALDGAEGTTVVTVLQLGYRAGEQVIRPARVAVSDPE